MSKIEAGHMKLECETIDLAPLIEESLRFTAIPAAQKNIFVEQRICDGMRPAWSRIAGSMRLDGPVVKKTAMGWRGL